MLLTRREDFDGIAAHSEVSATRFDFLTHILHVGKADEKVAALQGGTALNHHHAVSEFVR